MKQDGSEREWHRVGPSAEIDEGEPAHIRIGDRLIGVFRVEGSFYAIDNVCPHEFALLSEGEVQGDRVACPLHAAEFDIRTGECLSPPAEDDLETYPVREEDGDLFVGLPRR